MQDINLEVMPQMEEAVARLEDEIKPGFIRVR